MAAQLTHTFSFNGTNFTYTRSDTGAVRICRSKYTWINDANPGSSSAQAVIGNQQDIGPGFLVSQKKRCILDMRKDANETPRVSDGNFSGILSSLYPSVHALTFADLTRMKGLIKGDVNVKPYISYVSWLKGSQIPTPYTFQNVFVESGLGPDKIIVNQPFRTVGTLASKNIDPAGRSPPDYLFPGQNERIILDNNFLSQYGFIGPVAINSTTMPNNEFGYTITISTTGGPVNISNLAANGTILPNNRVTYNGVDIALLNGTEPIIYAGNRVKNSSIQAPRVNSWASNLSKKQALFIMKEMGDVIQVLLMWCWYQTNPQHNKDFVMTTGDDVVMLLCQMIGVNCISAKADKEGGKKVRRLEVYEPIGMDESEVLSKQLDYTFKEIHDEKQVQKSLIETLRGGGGGSESGFFNATQYGGARFIMQDVDIDLLVADIDAMYNVGNSFKNLLKDDILSQGQPGSALIQNAFSLTKQAFAGRTKHLVNTTADLLSLSRSYFLMNSIVRCINKKTLLKMDASIKSYTNKSTSFNAIELYGAQARVKDPLTNFLFNLQNETSPAGQSPSPVIYGKITAFITSFQSITTNLTSTMALMKISFFKKLKTTQVQGGGMDPGMSHQEQLDWRVRQIQAFRAAQAQGQVPQAEAVAPVVPVQAVAPVVPVKGYLDDIKEASRSSYFEDPSIYNFVDRTDKSTFNPFNDLAQAIEYSIVTALKTIGLTQKDLSMVALLLSRPDPTIAFTDHISIDADKDVRYQQGIIDNIFLLLWNRLTKQFHRQGYVEYDHELHASVLEIMSDISDEMFNHPVDSRLQRGHDTLIFEKIWSVNNSRPGVVGPELVEDSSGAGGDIGDDMGQYREEYHSNMSDGAGADEGGGKKTRTRTRTRTRKNKKAKSRKGKRKYKKKRKTISKKQKKQSKKK